MHFAARAYVPASADVSVRKLGRRAPPFLLSALYPNGDYWRVYQIPQTEVFSRWLAGLLDAKGTARVPARLDSPPGNSGDSRSLGGGLHEMRVFAGPGYRLYFAQRGVIGIALLYGGDKSSEQRNIARVGRLLAELELQPWPS